MFDQIRIIEYEKSYIHDYASLKSEFLKDIWTKEYESLFINDFKLLANQKIFLAYKGDTLVGQIFLSFKKESIYIEEIEVLEKFQRVGVGRILIDFITKRYPNIQICLLVETSNQNAINFYYRLGFEKIAEVNNYYQFRFNANKELKKND